MASGSAADCLTPVAFGVEVAVHPASAVVEDDQGEVLGGGHTARDAFQRWWKSLLVLDKQ